jgi:UDP-N-acetylbacillosamine N-acetyltransferase
VRKLLIVGAGNFPPEVEELAILNGYDTFAFLDDNPAARCHPIIGDLASIKDHTNEFREAIVAFGNNERRMEYTKKILAAGFFIPTLIHPTAYVSPDSVIGVGCIIRAHCVISRYAKIGAATILNVGALIDHDVVIGEGSHILMGAVIRNMVKLPPMSWIESNKVIE